MRKAAGSVWVTLGCLGWVLTAAATPIGIGKFPDYGSLSPTLQAGAPPDSPTARVDPNVPSSAFTGVVSINIRHVAASGQQVSVLCSGVAISARHVLTAAHCVDPLGNGVAIDLTKPGHDVRVALNDNDPFNAATDLITASKVSIHPDFAGFNLCPDGNTGCVNDDLAVLELPRRLPASVRIYEPWNALISSGMTFTTVGYGKSGNGLAGYTVGEGFFFKRQGSNVFDLFDGDDELGFAPGSPLEVFYYDFDGTKNGFDRDTLCVLFIVCSSKLPNGVETLFGEGDSGGPVFLAVGNDYLLAGIHTFSVDLNVLYGDAEIGDFGDVGGGVLLHPYLDWIASVTAVPVPQPGVLVLLGVGGAVLAWRCRRR